ncbi:MAG: hypothetical protein UT02_C0042G0002 [Parcubacteria group bacterium GW2011_GWC2_38_7]|nr:MAG: hypothetical protein UT02_C0042G0002 [Parcubacteria group bacterium GW2011_GWC2_38_7]
MFDLLFNSEISIDWAWIDTMASGSIFNIMWFFFINGGWILFVLTFLYGGWKFFVYNQQQRFGAKQTFVFLAIDVPKNNLQTPRAVENIFSLIAGAHSPLEWGEKKFEGKYQLGFSFEIVSLDGYVQFIIMTPSGFRNLVEASIYSQYPDVEITEVEDYTKAVTTIFPSDEYNLWGADLIPVNKDYYPIRSYLEFQEEFDPEVKFKDPMSAMLEIMNAIGPGEQIWFQIIVIPADNDWMHVGKKAISKIMGIPEKVTSTMLDKIIDIPLKGLSMVSEQLLASPLSLEDSKPEKFDINRLTPIQKNEVEAIARKIDRVCFDCKARYLYFGKKEVFKKGLAVSGIMGAIKQFTSTGLNALKPGKNKTQARLLFADYRLARLQNQMLEAYKDRNADTTVGTYILSTEELATLWHFPYISVKAPLVKKVEAKRGSAPIGLPLDFGVSASEDIKSVSVESEVPAEKIIDYDNDYFEERFAVDKSGKKDQARKEEVLEDLEDRKISFQANYQEESIVIPETLMTQKNKEGNTISTGRLMNVGPEDQPGFVKEITPLEQGESMATRGKREVNARDEEVRRYVEELNQKKQELTLSTPSTPKQSSEAIEHIEQLEQSEQAPKPRRSVNPPPNLPTV